MMGLRIFLKPQNLVDGLIGKLVELRLEYNKLALDHHRLRGKKGD